MQHGPIATKLAEIARVAKDTIDEDRKRLHVEQKGELDGVDLVTSADIAAEKAIISGLRESFPGCAIVSEETLASDETPEECFTIDPIDGTVNFANGLPLWGIQIGCIEGGKTTAAVIYLADLDRMYVADAKGASLNGEPIHVSSKDLVHGLYSIESLDRIIARREMMLAGYTNFREYYATCASFSFVASGEFAASSYLCSHPWDWVPGEFIVRMAGGVSYNDPVANVHIVANTEETLDTMVSFLKQGPSCL